MSWNPKSFHWRPLHLDIWLCTGVKLLDCKIRWKMSTLGEKAQVSCETALGGTKTQVFTAWLSQGNYILKHLWVNLCIDVSFCSKLPQHPYPLWQVMVPPKCSPTATPISYPMYSTLALGLLHKRKQLILTAEESFTNNTCLSFLVTWICPVQYFIESMSLMVQILI